MKTANLRKCKTCNGGLEGKRPDAFYCSVHCYDIRKRCPDRERPCKQCSAKFPVANRSDANRRYCSQSCAKKANTKIAAGWRQDRPGYMREYNATRIAKNPDVWVEKSRQNRREALALLGDKCIVCAAKNPNWLHIDYIPTTRNTPYRHSRGVAYIRRHLHLFRILCANHHYELTLTGRIEGTDITQ